MSYCASGSGSVVLKHEVPDDVLALLSSAEFLVEDASDGGMWLTFEFTTYNDQIDGAMNALAPYVESGNVEFSGEDFEKWRFHFKDGEVEEQSGDIVYRSRKNTNHTYRVVFMRRNEDENAEHEYYHDGVSITTDADRTEDICVDLMNGLSKYIDENNVEAVVDGVSEIYEEVD